MFGMGLLAIADIWFACFEDDLFRLVGFGQEECSQCTRSYMHTHKHTLIP